MVRYLREKVTYFGVFFKHAYKNGVPAQTDRVEQDRVCVVCRGEETSPEVDVGEERDALEELHVREKGAQGVPGTRIR